ncbi:hypothetical protein NDU88_003273 [Pleurodeles waltl]|uniref:Uncharacterized protein n=1 Tax=Pleurodeles waltl TaxID=8319 RepID=A0AAV7M3I7_PLEWA|nr:hypothetical protein NDU88_003273 [Pleurodeles waltl]
MLDQSHIETFKVAARGARPRWQCERMCLSVLRRLGLRHGSATPVGVNLGSLRIAPDAPDGGVPQGARDASGTAEWAGGAAWPVPAAGGRGLRRLGPHGWCSAGAVLLTWRGAPEPEDCRA